MPEYPDITVYIEVLERQSIQDLERQTLIGLRRVGKRIAFNFSNGHWMVMHLMIAGRLHWNSRRQASIHIYPDSRSTP